MKLIKYLLAIIVINLSIAATAQSNDSTVRFKVGGACEMCKQRIEETLRTRGIQFAEWNVDTKTLTMIYEPVRISLAKVHKLIAGAGHDTEFEKAKDAVYDELPACCHYRTIEKWEMKFKELGPESLNDSLESRHDQGQGSSLLKGVVLEENNKGSFQPLMGASVVWLGTSLGTITDTSGVFHIPFNNGYDRLVVSYTGYTSDTLSVTDIKELKIILASGNQLNEVKVFAKQRSVYLSAINPVRTQIMTEKELLKAACCNLSESFETNPSVDVTYSDAMTGSKQIQLLGLSGTYTQLTVENLPGPRGIVTPLGLNTIAGPWVESIQLIKGVGSVVNGFESIAGQINVELKKPDKTDRLYANGYINSMGKTDMNLNLTQKVGKRWNTALLIHDDFFANKTIDFNEDGFRDLPTGNQFTVVNRWKYEDNKGLMFQFGIKYLNDSRTGGETSFSPGSDKFTTNHYGLGIKMKRYDVFLKSGYVFPGKKYKSIGLQIAAFDHNQDSYFGLAAYRADQANFYANLIYQSIISTTAHKFRTGVSFVSDNYNEQFKMSNYKRTEVVPGAFFEYVYSPLEKFNIVMGLRADHNNMYDWFITPRLHVRYQPLKNTTIRLSAGRGQRTANIFAENMSVLVSGREVRILGSSVEKGYGLEPEVAWNKGISIDQKLRLFNRDASFGVDYFRNDFTKQVVVDVEETRTVKFYNVSDNSFSNSFQVEFNAEPARKLEVRIAYRLFDVRTTYGDQLLQRPFTAKHRAFANFGYEVSGWKFDYTFNYNGSKRIPGTANNPPEFQRATASPSYIVMNAQVSKVTGKKYPVEFYLGGENLTNYFQKDVIIAADQPFSNYFDASLVWGPPGGRLVYAGFRYKLK